MAPTEDMRKIVDWLNLEGDIHDMNAMLTGVFKILSKASQANCKKWCGQMLQLLAVQDAAELMDMSDIRVITPNRLADTLSLLLKEIKDLKVIHSAKGTKEGVCEAVEEVIEQLVGVKRKDELVKT